MPQFMPAEAGGAAPAFISAAVTDTDYVLSTGDWTDADMGAVAGGGQTRTMVVVYSSIGPPAPLSSATLNGVSLNILVEISTGSGTVGIAWAEVPTGTTGITLAPTWSDTPTDVGFVLISIISVGSLANTSTNTDTGVCADTLALDLTASSPGTLIAGLISGGQGANTSNTITELTEVGEGDIRSSEIFTASMTLYDPTGGSKSIDGTCDAGDGGGNFSGVSAEIHLA